MERDQTPAAPSNAHANAWEERPSHPAAQQSDQRREGGSCPSREREGEDEDSDSIFGDECDHMGGSQHGGVQDLGEHMGRRGLSDVSEEMQFELRVLEVVLDYVTAFMEHLSSDLEAVAYPGLDAIVAKVNINKCINTNGNKCIIMDTVSNSNMRWNVLHIRARVRDQVDIQSVMHTLAAQLWNACVSSHLALN